VDVTEKMLFAGIVPGAVALALLLAGRRPWRRPVSEYAGRWALSLAIVLGVVASFLLLHRDTSGRWTWIVWAIAAAGGVGTVAGVLDRNWPILRPVFLLLLVAVMSGVLWPAYYDDTPIWLRFAPFVGGVVLVASVESFAYRHPGPGLPLTLTIALAGLFSVVVLSGNATIADLAAPLIAVLVATGVVALLDPRMTMEAGGGAVVAASMPAFATLAWVNSYDLPGAFIAAFILATGSPLFLWVGECRFVEKRSLLVRWSMRLVLIALPAVGAALLAILNSEPSAY